MKTLLHYLKSLILSLLRLFGNSLKFLGKTGVVVFASLIVVSTLIPVLQSTPIDTSSPSFYVQPVKIGNTVLNVLIVQKVPETFDATNNNEWNAIEMAALSPHINAIVFQRWQGYGGNIFMMNTFIQTMAQAKLNGVVLIFNVVGQAFSAHAYSLCVADDNDRINFDPSTTILFHPAHETLLGGLAHTEKLPFIAQHIIDVDEQLCVTNHIMTPAVLQMVKDGKRVVYYLNSDGHLAIRIQNSDED